MESLLLLQKSLQNINSKLSASDQISNTGQAENNDTKCLEIIQSIAVEVNMASEALMKWAGEVQSHIQSLKDANSDLNDGNALKSGVPQNKGVGKSKSAREQRKRNKATSKAKKNQLVIKLTEEGTASVAALIARMADAGELNVDHWRSDGRHPKPLKVAAADQDVFTEALCEALPALATCAGLDGQTRDPSKAPGEQRAHRVVEIRGLRKETTLLSPEESAAPAPHSQQACKVVIRYGGDGHELHSAIITTHGLLNNIRVRPSVVNGKKISRMALSKQDAVMAKRHSGMKEVDYDVPEKLRGKIIFGVERVIAWQLSPWGTNKLMRSVMGRQDWKAEVKAGTRMDLTLTKKGKHELLGHMGLWKAVKKVMRNNKSRWDASRAGKQFWRQIYKIWMCPIRRNNRYEALCFLSLREKATHGRIAAAMRTMDTNKPQQGVKRVYSWSLPKNHVRGKKVMTARMDVEKKLEKATLRLKSFNDTEAASGQESPAAAAEQRNNRVRKVWRKGSVPSGFTRVVARGVRVQQSELQHTRVWKTEAAKAKRVAQQQELQTVHENALSIGRQHLKGVKGKEGSPNQRPSSPQSSEGVAGMEESKAATPERREGNITPPITPQHPLPASPAAPGSKRRRGGHTDAMHAVDREGDSSDAIDLGDVSDAIETRPPPALKRLRRDGILGSTESEGDTTEDPVVNVESESGSSSDEESNSDSEGSVLGSSIPQPSGHCGTTTPASTGRVYQTRSRGRGERV